MPPSPAPPTERLLAFSGGGFNTHSILAGIFAGALDHLERLGDEGGLQTLMRDVDGIAGNSGGSWFLTHLVHSQIFSDQFDTSADRDAYTTTGYLGAVKELGDRVNTTDVSLLAGAQEILAQISDWTGTISQFLLDNFPEGSPAALQLFAELGLTAAQLLQEFLGAANRVIGELSGFLVWSSLSAQGSTLDQRLISTAMVYGPLGMDHELAGRKLQDAPLAWAAHIDFSIAAALPTRDTILHIKPWLLGFDRMWSSATPPAEGAHARPLALDSIVDQTSPRTAQATLPGDPVFLSYGNDQFLGPAGANVEVSSVLDASALGLIDATAASSAALGLLASPDVFGAIAWLVRAGSILGGDLLAALGPIEKNLAQALREMAPLGSLANGIFSMPEVPTDVDDFGTRYGEAIDQRQIRLIDGAYIDNTSAAFALRQSQSTQGVIRPFDLTVFSSSNESTSAGVAVRIDSAGMLSDFVIRRDVALLFGLAGSPSAPDGGVRPPGAVIDGPFPVLPNQMPSPQIFAPEAWWGEQIEWEFQSGDLQLRLFDLNVTTVDNPELGIVGGQTGRLRVFAVNNQDASIFPFGLFSNYQDNYGLLRAAIADEAGGLHLLSALGLLPLISLEASPPEVLGGNQPSVLTGRTGDDTLYGGESDDLLNGRLGADRMFGGKGADIYVCDNPDDWVVEYADSGIDVVRSRISYVLGDHLEALLLLGDTGLTGTGNALDNRLLGSAADDVLIGLGGDDLLNGRGGQDSMYGGAGDDVFIVDHALDQVFEDVEAGFDSVRSGVSFELTAHLENLRLTGDVAVDGRGNALKNHLVGNGAANTLEGEGGRDWLFGGAGADVLLGCLDGAAGGRGERDTLRGGLDRDVFVLGNSNGCFYNDGLGHTAGRADYALVLDFTVGEDVLQLHGAATDYFLAPTGFNTASGTGLWWNGGGVGELIAVLRSVDETVLTGLNTLEVALFT